MCLRTHLNILLQKQWIMLYESPFISLMADSTGSQAVIALDQIVSKLAAIRTLFDYGMSPREITQKNLVSLETDLRDIQKEITTSPGIKSLLWSTDAPLESLRGAIIKLNLAADVFDMTTTLKRREQLYQYYIDISNHLSQAIDYLQNRR